MKPRDARPGDLADLGELEVEGFATDRLSRRNMRRLLSSPSAALRVLGNEGALAGYHLVLFRHGSNLARLYSLVVGQHHRGQGVAQVLIADAEEIAARRRARALRLEVREDNARAIRFYTRLGYRRIGERAQYYADNANAVLFEKPLHAADAVASPGRAREPDGDEDRSPRPVRDPAPMFVTARPPLAVRGRRPAVLVAAER